MDNTTTNVQGEQWEGTAKPFNFPDPEYVQIGPEPVAGITNAQDLDIWEERVEAIKKKRISYKSELEKMTKERNMWRTAFIAYIIGSAIGTILITIL